MIRWYTFMSGVWVIPTVVTAVLLRITQAWLAAQYGVSLWTYVVVTLLIMVAVVAAVTALGSLRWWWLNRPQSLIGQEISYTDTQGVLHRAVVHEQNQTTLTIEEKD